MSLLGEGVYGRRGALGREVGGWKIVTATECRYYSVRVSPCYPSMSQGRSLIKWPLAGCDLISLRRPDAWFNCNSAAERRGVEKSEMNDHVLVAWRRYQFALLNVVGIIFRWVIHGCRPRLSPLRATAELALLTRLTCCSPHLQAHSLAFGLSPPGWMRDARPRPEVIHFS